jgi:hypothetical protein
LRALWHGLWLLALGAGVCLLGPIPGSGCAQAAQIAVSGGPSQLLISYRAAAADRPAFRTYLETHEARLLAGLERTGVLASWQILFNPLVQPRTWDAMTILTFRRYADTRRWWAIEQTSPGGLDAAGLRLARPVGTYSCDLSWTDAAAQPGPVADHVFYVIPYSYQSKGEYEDYVSGYVIPQVEAWIQAGALSRYRIYLNRYPVGEPEPWDALFVYEYRDLQAFGDRDDVMAAARQRLRSDPAWAALGEIKSNERTEAENTIAQWLAGG